eukprot:364405-Chlamydomonas_euryale.AAC.4
MSPLPVTLTLTLCGTKCDPVWNEVIMRVHSSCQWCEPVACKSPADPCRNPASLGVTEGTTASSNKGNPGGVKPGLTSLPKWWEAPQQPGCARSLRLP